MNVIDLTHIISETMPVYPGTAKPKLKVSNTYEKDGFREALLTMGSHTGTHIDAPAHIIEGKKTLDSFDISQFVGRALVIDCRMLKEGEEITAQHILKYGDKIKEADFLLFNLGWDKRWGDDSYFGKYPCLSDDAMDIIINGSYKGIGFDVISIDPIKDSSLRIHKRLFSNKEIINIENLKNLDLCVDKLFTFVCLPLKLENADGSPARAIGILED